MLDLHIHEGDMSAWSCTSTGRCRARILPDGDSCSNSTSGQFKKQKRTESRPRWEALPQPNEHSSMSSDLDSPGCFQTVQMLTFVQVAAKFDCHIDSSIVPYTVPDFPIANCSLSIIRLWFTKT